MNLLKRLFPNMSLPKFARWGAILGSLMLLVPLVIFLVEGELNSLGFVALVVGVIGLGLWLIVAPDELRAWLSGRQVYYGTGTVVLIVIVIGIAAVGYSLVERQNIVRDLTENQLYSISQISRDTIRQFEERYLTPNNFSARIIGFYTREEIRERNATRVLLSQFEEESNGLIDVEFIDPDVDPFVAGQYDFSPLLSSSESNRLFLAVFTQDEQIVTVEPINAIDERQISSAMRRILLAGSFKIYFVIGHLGYDPLGEGNLGLSTVYNSLPAAGVNVDTLDLSAVEGVPDDATAIVVVGPQTPFQQAEVDKIADYIAGGGRMVILADPPHVDNYDIVVNNEFLLEDSPFSQYLWDEFGIRAREDLVSDSGSSFQNEFNLVVVQFVQNHPIMAGFPATEIFLPFARSTEIVDLASTDNPTLTERQAQYVREPMLLSTNDSFGETRLLDVDVDNLADFDADEDTPGPLILAVSVRHVDDDGNLNNLPRVVLIGDAAWLTNQFINPLEGQAGVAGNIQLWNNIVEWEIQFSERVNIDAVTRPEIIPLTVTDQQQGRIQLVTLVLLPSMVLGLGVFVWINRRRH